MFSLTITKIREEKPFRIKLTGEEIDKVLECINKHLPHRKNGGTGREKKSGGTTKLITYSSTDEPLPTKQTKKQKKAIELDDEIEREDMDVPLPPHPLPHQSQSQSKQNQNQN